MADKPVVTVAGVSKAYGRIKAVRDVDLEVDSGEVVCIIGPSGCGKSTLLRCINFLEESDSGFVCIDGQPIGMLPTADGRRRDSESNINRMRTRIGMVFQQFNVWPHLTVLGNVMKPLTVVLRLETEVAQQRALELLGRVELLDKTDAYAAELSGGQLQRVAIARAMAMEPRLMLLDEPTSSLDPELVAEVLDVMRTMVLDGTTMIVVTHELGFALQVADRIIFMDEGRIVEQGPPKQILYNPQSERLKLFLSHVHYDGTPGQSGGGRLAREGARTSGEPTRSKMEE